VPSDRSYFPPLADEEKVVALYKLHHASVTLMLETRPPDTASSDEYTVTSTLEKKKMKRRTAGRRLCRIGEVHQCLCVEPPLLQATTRNFKKQKKKGDSW
jgi:hypothetical protein